jgi:hypothetical protein
MTPSRCVPVTKGRQDLMSDQVEDDGIDLKSFWTVMLMMMKLEPV